MSKDYAKIIDESVRIVKDFPKPGVLEDISTLLADPVAFAASIEGIIDSLKDVEFDVIGGIEARGFIFGTPIALHFKKKFVMIRKKNKLPGETITYEYKKEYGSDILELATGVIKPGEKVIMVDDLMATGGSALAACMLVRKAEGIVAGVVCPIELGGLPGRELLEKNGIPYFAMLTTEQA